MHTESKPKAAEFKVFFENNPDLLFVLDSRGLIVEANQNACRLLNLKRQKLIGRRLEDFVPQHMHVSVKRLLESAIAEDRASGEFSLNSPDGATAQFEWGMRANMSNGFVLCTGHDIMHRVVAEEKLKQQVQQKDYNIRESHHRMKNHLQILSSLLNLQAATNGTSLKDLVREYDGRIQSVALIHDELNQENRSSDNFEVTSYLVRVAQNTVRSYCLSDRKPELTTDCTPVSVSVEHAMPLGLILNEIISNSMKYAYPFKDPCHITLCARRIGDQLVLEVSDNGPGLPARLTLEKAKTLGLRLIRMLIQQLRGSIRIQRRSGTTYFIEIPLDRKKESLT